MKLIANNDCAGTNRFISHLVVDDNKTACGKSLSTLKGGWRWLGDPEAKNPSCKKCLRHLYPRKRSDSSNHKRIVYENDQLVDPDKAKIFHDWFRGKYVTWRAGKIGHAGSMSAFAEYLGIPRPAVASWLEDSRVPRDFENMLILSLKLGTDVLDVLGLAVPSKKVFTQYPGIPGDLIRLLNDMLEKIDALNIGDVEAPSLIDKENVLSIFSDALASYRSSNPVMNPLSEVNNFHGWIKKQYVEWKYLDPTRNKWVGDFVKILGVSRQTVQYMLCDPDYGPLKPGTVDRLVSLFGDEILSIPGAVPPGYSADRLSKDVGDEIPTNAYSVMLVDPLVEDTESLAYTFSYPYDDISDLFCRCDGLGAFVPGENHPWINILNESGHVLKCVELSPASVPALKMMLGKTARPVAV